MIIYTAGYSGCTQRDLVIAAMKLKAKVIDIRLSPRSRNPDFCQERMSEFLHPNFYFHYREFGNLNYRGGPIEIVDFEAGELKLREILDDVILLCVCKDTGICHRTLLGEKLSALGYTVEEIDLKFPLGPIQGTMF